MARSFARQKPQEGEMPAPGAGQLKALIQAAAAARLMAYAPYSKFHVGAAVLDDQGRVHAGCNVENAAYPQGQCAEAGALAAMVLAGSTGARALVVCGDGRAPCMPCGGCRQRLREFAPPTLPVIIADAAGKVLARHTLGELLPASFGPGHLDKA